jgi:hypothetical protein
MSVFESDLLQPRLPRPAGERRFQVLSVAALALFLGYVTATVVGAPRADLSLFSSLTVLPVPFVAWWTWVRAPDNLRPTFLLCAWAATLWLAAVVIWYATYLADGSQMPPSPGVWDIFLIAGRLLLIGAILALTRSCVSLRIAALDASVIVAAGVAVGAAFIGRGLEERVTPGTLVTLNRPILGIVTLILIASAAFGSWEGLPRSIVYLGLGEVGLTVGSLIYSYSAVQGEFADDRWADLPWAVGAGFSMLAGAVIILGIDRPVRMPDDWVARESPRFGPVLTLTATAVAVTLGVAAYGLATDRRIVSIIGVAASAAIAIAMACRATDAIRSARRSSNLLDDALVESERIRDDLKIANQSLQRKNAELELLQVAVAQAFRVIDERTRGRLWALVHEAGNDLAALVDETLDDDD